MLQTFSALRLTVSTAQLMVVIDVSFQIVIFLEASSDEFQQSLLRDCFFKPFKIVKSLHPVPVCAAGAQKNVMHKKAMVMPMIETQDVVRTL